MEKHFEDFLRDLEIRNYSPESIRKYSHCVGMFLGHLKTKKVFDLRRVGREELRAYAETLLHNPKYSLHHVGANIRAIKCFFKFLRKTGVISMTFRLC